MMNQSQGGATEQAARAARRQSGLSIETPFSFNPQFNFPIRDGSSMFGQVTGLGHNIDPHNQRVVYSRNVYNQTFDDISTPDLLAAPRRGGADEAPSANSSRTNTYLTSASPQSPAQASKV